MTNITAALGLDTAYYVFVDREAVAGDLIVRLHVHDSRGKAANMALEQSWAVASLSGAVQQGPASLARLNPKPTHQCLEKDFRVAKPVHYGSGRGKGR